MADGIPECPLCHEELEGLGTYCHDCNVYVSDHQDGEAAEEPQEPPRRRNDPRKEADIRQAIKAALEAHGFVVWDFEQGWRRDGSTRVVKGLPDLYIFGHGVQAWRELKSAKGRLTDDQEGVGLLLQAEGVDWGVWRHEDEAIAWAREVTGR